MSTVRHTIFTPTYNRAHTLPRVYESLAAQTRRDFEWLIIDDGSTDETCALITALAEHAPFPIRYIPQSNGGKYRAYNRALREAHGDFFIVLDSDDALLPDALEQFETVWQALAPTNPDAAGIMALCLNGDTHELLGTIGDTPHMSDPDALTYQLTHRLYLDKCVLSRTDILRHYPFPEPEGMRFIPEALIGNRINAAHRFIIHDHPVKVVYYQTDGISLNILASYAAHAQGRMLYHLAAVNEIGTTLLRHDPIRFLKDLIQVFRMAAHARLGLLHPLSALRHPVALLLSVAAAPLGYLLYLYDKIRLKKMQGPR